MQQPDDQFDDQNVDAASEAAETHHAPAAPPRAAVPAWMISLALHALVALGFSLVAFNQAAKEEELPPMVVQNVEPPPPVTEEEKNKQIEEIQQTEIAVDKPVDQPQKVETPVAEVQETTPTETAPVDTPTLASSESNSDAVGMNVIAAGGSGGGSPLSTRSGNGKRAGIMRYGGSAGSERAVDNALRWFQRHQSPDGSWSPATYTSRCTGSTPCEPGAVHNHESGENADNGSEQIGITGLVTLCYLGAGYDHQTPNKYQATVKKSIAWLLSVQRPDGSFRNCFSYSQAIGTMALAEALAMSNDSNLRSATQRGVNYLLSTRLPAGPAAQEVARKMGKKIQALGWGDWHHNGDNRTSATGWGLQALKSAHIAGVDVRDGMDGARVWLKMLWQGTNGLLKLPQDKVNDPSKLDVNKDTTTLAYVLNGNDGKVSGLDEPHKLWNMAPLGVMAGLYLGFDKKDPMIQTMRNHVLKYDLPQPGKAIYNLYYTYYGTFAMFQMGGKDWQIWNKEVRDRLVSSQRRDGCRAGSWSPNGNFYGSNVNGTNIGPILTTAFSCLCLEVYYRYQQVHGE
jgi:hypothetical protein